MTINSLEEFLTIIVWKVYCCIFDSSAFTAKITIIFTLITIKEVIVVCRLGLLSTDSVHNTIIPVVRCQYLQISKIQRKIKGQVTDNNR